MTNHQKVIKENTLEEKDFKSETDNPYHVKDFRRYEYFQKSSGLDFLEASALWNRYRIGVKTPPEARN